MTVLVCGSRGWTDERAIRDRLLRVMDEHGDGVLVLHGGARGADHLTGKAARLLGLSVREFPADWETFGHAAGIRRNDRMLDERPDVVLAFWDGVSPGTRHAIIGALSRRIDIEVIFS